MQEAENVMETLIKKGQDGAAPLEKLTPALNSQAPVQVDIFGRFSSVSRLTSLTQF